MAGWGRGSEDGFRPRTLTPDQEATDVLMHLGWNAMVIPLEISSAGVALAVPAGTADVLPEGVELISEETSVELGQGAGDLGEPSGEFTGVRFVIALQEEFAETIVLFQAASDGETLTFSANGALPTVEGLLRAWYD